MYIKLQIAAAHCKHVAAEYPSQQSAMYLQNCMAWHAKPESNNSMGWWNNLCSCNMPIRILEIRHRMLLAYTHRLLINVVLHSFSVSLSFNLWPAMRFTINGKYKGHMVYVTSLTSVIYEFVLWASRNTMVGSHVGFLLVEMDNTKRQNLICQVAAHISLLWSVNDSSTRDWVEMKNNLC
jgi:uncharacterized membrane protein